MTRNEAHASGLAARYKGEGVNNWGSVPARGPAADLLLRVNIGNLRHKLEDGPARPLYIVTEPGVGYRLRADGISSSGSPA